MGGLESPGENRLGSKRSRWAGTLYGIRDLDVVFFLALEALQVQPFSILGRAVQDSIGAICAYLVVRG